MLQKFSDVTHYLIHLEIFIGHKTYITDCFKRWICSTKSFWSLYLLCVSMEATDDKQVNKEMYFLYNLRDIEETDPVETCRS